MDSSGNKGKATYLNCFFRSLMFRRVATLSGIDSGSLFLKGIFVSSMTLFTILLIVLYNAKVLDYITIILVAILVFVFALEFTLGIVLTAFIYNLFLADSFMKIVNILMFSGSHGILIGAILLTLLKYKVNVNYGRSNTTVQPETAERNIGVLESGAAGTSSWKKEIEIRIEHEHASSIALMFFVVSFMAFCVLLVKNIRALRRK